MRHNKSKTQESYQPIEGEGNNRFPCVERLINMSKKVTIDSDLSTVLEDYLKKLHDYDKYIENDIFNVNFAEAALFIEYSVQVYGKKVDTYWDMVFDYQKRLVESTDSHQEKNEEMAKLEERKQKYKRRRKCKQDDTQVSQLVNQFSWGVPEDHDYLNKNLEPHNLVESWTALDQRTNACSERSYQYMGYKSHSVFLPNTSMYSEDQEFIGRYDQLHSANLIEDIFELDKSDHLSSKDRALITDLHVDCHVTHDYLFVNRKDEVEGSGLAPYIRNFVQTRKENDLSRQTFVHLERLAIQTVAEKLRRISAADSMFDTSFDDSQFSPSADNTETNSIDINANCEHPKSVSANLEMGITGNFDDIITNEVTFDKVAETIQNRTKSCGQDSAFFEMDDEMPLSEPSPVFGSGTVVITARSTRRPTRLILSDDDKKVFKQPKPPKRPRLTKRMRERIEKRTMTTNHRLFETFYRREYKPAENEGVIPPLEESSDEEDNDFDTGCPTIEDVLTSEKNNIGTENRIEILSNLVISPERTESVFDYRRHSQESNCELEEEASKQKVQEWRNFILPKLRQMEKKSDFDMREYTTKIIDPIPLNHSKSFKEIVSNKSHSEIARFFTAALQLANTNNIEIQGVQSGCLSNETFQIKVIDKTQHYELFDEYQAPSEETFRERLERAKQSQSAAHSTPNSDYQTPRKKIKVNCQKKLF